MTQDKGAQAMTYKDLRETLERMDKDAAPGPWEWHFKQNTDPTGEAYVHLAKITAPIEGDYLLDVLDANGEWSSEDFKLIVSLRNSLPQIIRALRLAEVVPEVEEALVASTFDGNPPMQDEQGGCALCGGQSMESSFIVHEENHEDDCPYVLVKSAIARLQSAKEPT
jgi:hypothetical protein